MPSPNPTWKPGDKINSPVTSMVTIDPAKTAPTDLYKLLIGSVVPRPIALVSTLSATGQGNLAPFSSYNFVTSRPPCIVFSVFPGADGKPKDTLRNILETKEFVVNSASEWLVEPLVHCAAAYPYGVNEMEKVGLTPLVSSIVKPPRVAESPIHFECKLQTTVEIKDGDVTSTIVVGRIVMAHVMTEAYQNGKVKSDVIRPVARMGGFGYSLLGDQFDIKIPDIS